MADIDIGDIIRQISSGLKSARYKSPDEEAEEKKKKDIESYYQGIDKNYDRWKADQMAERMEGVKSEHALRLQQAGAGSELVRTQEMEKGALARQGLVSQASGYGHDVSQKIAQIQAASGERVADITGQAHIKTAETTTGPKEDLYTIGLKVGMPLKDVKEYVTARGGGPQVEDVTPASAAPLTAAAAPPTAATPLSVPATARKTLMPTAVPTTPVWGGATGKSMAGYYPSLLSGPEAAQTRAKAGAIEQASAQAKEKKFKQGQEARRKAAGL